MQKDIASIPIQGPFLQATLPLPPSANNMYKNISWRRQDGKMSSRRAATPELLIFQKEALYRLSQARVQNWTLIEFIRTSKKKVPLYLELVFYRRTLWKMDEDAQIKAAQDVIFQFLALNDTLVTDIYARKRVDQDNPHCTIALSFAQIGGDEA